MAPIKANMSSTLEVPSLPPFSSSSSSPTLSSSTSDLKSSSDTPLSPRTLYAQSFDHNRTFTFDRPHSSQSLPSAGRFRKNMKDITGFGTTDAEFEALPIAVRRKVRELYFVKGIGWITSQTRGPFRKSGPPSPEQKKRNAQKESVYSSK
jgi:hypothetical protein